MDDCALYTNPQLYDLLFPNARDMDPGVDEARRKRSVASEQFYLQEARKSGSPILELGCGSGRLTVLIAQSGVEVIGVDLSKPMLETARAKAQRAGVRVPFLEGDMRNFEVPRKFSAIFIPGNSLLHLLTSEDVKQCFASVHRHLLPHGRLIFDVSKWDLTKLACDPEQRVPVMQVNGISIEETASYDSASQIRDVTWHFSDSRVVQYRLRVIFPQELLLLLEQSGFHLDARYGEFTRESFESSSPRQVCICSLSAP